MRHRLSGRRELPAHVSTARRPGVRGGANTRWKPLPHERQVRRPVRRRSSSGRDTSENTTCSRGVGRARSIRASGPAWAPVRALDAVYVRGALRVHHLHRSHLRQARFASDHLPLYAELELV